MRLVLLTILFFSLAANVFFLQQSYRNNIVVRVPDGDSLDLADGRRIRLFSLDAPEKNRCGADTARNLLSSFVLGKHVRLTDIVKDDYGRQLANVFVGKMLVNEEMAREGAVRFVSVKSSQFDRVKNAAEEAKEARRGIWGPPCRTTEPPKPECLMKGNARHGGKFYQLPQCKQYQQIIIDESYGDRWFCTEEEAQAAGFFPAPGC